MHYRKRFVPRPLFPLILIGCLIAVLTSCSQEIQKTESSRQAETAVTVSESTILPSQPASTATPTSPPTPTPTPTISAITFSAVDETGNTYADALTIEDGDGYRVILGGDQPFRIEDSTSTAAVGDEFNYWMSTNTEASQDGTKIAILSNVDVSKTGDLLYYDGKTSVKVSGNVDSFHISNDGSTIAYLTGTYEHGIGDPLYLYDCKSGISMHISDGAGRLFSLSPGGAALAYTTFYEADNVDALACWCSISGEKPAYIGKDMYCVALTDDGDLKYCVKICDVGQELHAIFLGQDTLLCGSYIGYFQIPIYLLNDDASQIVFSDTSSTFVSVYGCTPVMFAAGGNAVFADTWVTGQQPTHLVRICSDRGRRSTECQYSGTANLCSVIFQSGENNTLSSFDKNMKVTSGTSISDFGMSAASVFSLSGYAGDLYVTRDNDIPVLIMSNVNSKGLSKIAEKPDVLYFLAMNARTDTTGETNRADYYPYGTLYSLEDAAGAVPIKISDKVCKIDVGNFGVIYKKYTGTENDADYISGYSDRVDVYYSLDRESFSKVLTQTFQYSIGG